MYQLQTTNTDLNRTGHDYHPVRQSRYYRLPQVLFDLIWSYDDRYKIQFKSCVYELTNYFNHNRLICRLNWEQHLFNVYMDIQINTRPKCNRLFSDYYAYILTRIERYGHLMCNDNLDCFRLKHFSHSQIIT
jgi:hypothetical protein